MRPKKQISTENVARALKTLYPVAELCSPDESKGPLHTETEHEEYLTVRQAAERIKYREQTFRNMMSVGVFRRGLHYYKRRGRVLFLWSRIKRWLEEDPASSHSPGAADPVFGENDTRKDGDQPFFPVHRARSRKKRQTVL